MQILSVHIELVTCNLPLFFTLQVLAVQRAEQARQAAATAGPDNSQDPGGFLNSLPTALRQQVLADMDDSQISGMLFSLFHVSCVGGR